VVRMTMHRYQTHNFRFRRLRQKIVSAYNIAAVCCNSHVQENMLISDRFTSIQGKAISRLSENRVHWKILECHFDTQKQLKGNTATFTHFTLHCYRIDA